MPKSRRKATHAGSWYSNQPEELAGEIEGWLADVPPLQKTPVRAVIAPHAGYRYSGHVMAHAYRHIDPERVSRIFLLGPSHHFFTQHCLVTAASTYSTPLGPIDVDAAVCRQLLASGAFQQMPLQTDEAEHSLEMHLPYIAFIMRNRRFTLVPIMVGAISSEREASYGRVLAPFLTDPANLFIVSSDFCHWGSRFNFTFYDPGQGPIHESIRWLDYEGIAAILKGDSVAFHDYMQEYSNTICGRHPIAVFLQCLNACRLEPRLELTKYDQSSKCMRPSDSSVSYASILISF